MMDMYPTSFFFFFFFPSLFSQPPTFLPHSHQISFLFLHSPSCLFYNSSFSPKTKRQFFLFTQKTRRKRYITLKMREEEATAKEEEARSRRRRSPLQQWVYGFMLELKIAYLIQNFAVCLVGQNLEERKRKNNLRKRIKKSEKEGRLRVATVIKEKKEKKFFKYYSSV